MLLFMDGSYSTVWMCCILLIHSAVDESLRCVQFLSTMNNAVISIGVKDVVCGCVFVRPEYTPRSWIGKSHATSIFNLLRNCQTVRQLHHFTIPLAMREGSNFSTSSPTLVIICLCDYSHFSGCEAETHWGFDLHFLNE